MLYITTLLNLLEILIIIVPVLLVVAFVTVAERKTMASMQRRLGPNIVGYYGLLQAFADALKLLLKEYISPTQANMTLFFLGPIITLIFSLLGYAVIPYGPGLGIFDFNIGILYMLAVSSLATYGILLAGWSANSKYAFLGSLRSTAQLISYELVLTSGILIVVFITGSFNLTINVEIQRSVWLVAPLFPIFIIFFISAVAETNRAPFDLAEAESELVSGFMTEHSAVIFVFFFLAEYASIVLICIFMSLLFFGGYTINFDTIIYIVNILYFLFSYVFVFVNYILVNIFDLYMWVTDSITNSPIESTDYSNSNNINTTSFNEFKIDNLFSNSIVENGIYSLTLAIKSFVLIFVFIWVRASLPRIRYDQLMSFCWTVMLPIVFGFIIFLLCLMYLLRITPCTALFF